ncbi:MAG: C40 family peptidase [Paracoccaceae bacterium]
MTTFDRRLTPARADLAAEALRGEVEADRFATGSPDQISAPFTALRPRPDFSACPDTELLFGQTVIVFERANGWAWLQADADGYVGYAPEGALHGTQRPASTHRVATLGSNLYAEPTLKIPTLGQLPFGAEVSVLETRDGYARIGPQQWLPAQHLRPVDDSALDWVGVAEMFVGVPYIWGGRTNWGLDCSGLVQLARQAGGYACPRDSDMQFHHAGETLPDDADLRRGDLIFWPGHVGIMTDGGTLLHANGHHMAVVREPLAKATTRIHAAEGSDVTRRARFRD